MAHGLNGLLDMVLFTEVFLLLLLVLPRWGPLRSLQNLVSRLLTRRGPRELMLLALVASCYVVYTSYEKMEERGALADSAKKDTHTTNLATLKDAKHKAERNFYRAVSIAVMCLVIIRLKSMHSYLAGLEERERKER